MSFATRNALSAYSQVSLDSRIASASPHVLITMLFDGAIAAIAKAKFHMERVNAGQGEVENVIEGELEKIKIGVAKVESIAEKGKAISRAIAIIEDGLMASLNLEVGGELAGHLYWLYEYMSQRLVLANLHNDVEYLDEVTLRLSELRDAWNGMELKQADDPRTPGKPTVSTSGVVTYGKV